MESSTTPTSEDVKTVQLLAKGLLELYEPPLTTINTHLKELTEKQDAVHSMLTSEKRKLEDLQNDAMLDALLADIATNREKLVSISNSMMSLHKKFNHYLRGQRMWRKLRSSKQTRAERLASTP